ncbi:Down syndrome cell adhesion molecule-like protein 1 [Trichinella spiralis]|uniref:Down syndrome cell adhesion molecule-like protein 1 n=1 Tax=Trichinella spiralis TaxID=6334 RepID=A0A0V1B6F9_TRISP|nr:Down syndrome cell adhesion molecule-like protein 1 [Trichinella spiralis]
MTNHCLTLFLICFSLHLLFPGKSQRLKIFQYFQRDRFVTLTVSVLALITNDGNDDDDDGYLDTFSVDSSRALYKCELLQLTDLDVLPTIIRCILLRNKCQKLRIPVASQQSQWGSCFGGISAGLDEFVKQPQGEPYYVTVGSPGLVLPCVVQSKYASAPYSVYWMRLVDNTPYLVQADSKYEIDRHSCDSCFNLRIKTVDYSRDNGKFYCQIAGPDGFASTSVVAEVVVLVHPQKPTLTKDRVETREGQLERLQCESIGGNPPPEMRWFFDNGTEVTRLATVHNATSKDKPTVSTLTWHVSADENGLRLGCKVWNLAMGKTAPAQEIWSQRLLVRYPPKVTVGPDARYGIEVGQEAKLTCSARANPPPTRYSWRRTGGARDSTWTEQNISLTVERDDSGSYVCKAENADGSGEATLDLDVQYGPELVVADEVVVQQGETLVLKCVANANPPAKSDCGPRPPATRIPLPPSTCPTYVASRLAITPALPATSCVCTAPVRRRAAPPRNVPAHAPGEARITVAEPVLVGSTVVLNCSASDPGYPAARFRWKAPGQRDYEYGARFSYPISDVQLTHAGDYWCQPFNDVGDGQASKYKLIVREPARLVKTLKSEDTVREKETNYRLICSAQGNPVPNITWYFNDQPVSSERFLSILEPEAQNCDVPERCSYKVSSSLQWLTGMRWNDKGYYTCQAYNGAGRASESRMLLKVQHRPVVVNDPDRPTVAAQLGHRARISCRASASPEPVFRWYRNGQELSQSNVDFGSTQQRNHSFDVYENTLLLSDVHQTDLGAYTCKVANLFGEDSFVFTLQPKSKPSPASDLKAEPLTHRSMRLSWIPGFDGGETQQFTVEISHDGRVIKTISAPATEPPPSQHFVGIETPRPVEFNVTNLAPLTVYSFRVKAINKIGESEWTQPLVAITSDSPINPSIPAPDSASYDSMTQVLAFQPPLDPNRYCLMIYLLKSSDLWERWDCVSETDKVELVPTAASLRVRNCYQQTLECSEVIEAAIGVATAVGWEVVAAICFTVLLFVLVVAVVGLYCRRHRLANEKNHLVNNGNGVGVYGSDCAKNRQISAPIYAEKTFSASNLGVDRNTGSSKDSGVFTSMSNYQYDGPLVNGTTVNYTADTNGATLPFSRGYEEQQQQQHWQQQQHCGGDYTTTAAGEPGYGHLGNGYTMPVVYGQNFVDMNPAGGSIYASREGSIHSGYSTPSQKRFLSLQC